MRSLLAPNPFNCFSNSLALPAVAAAKPKVPLVKFSVSWVKSLNNLLSSPKISTSNSVPTS